MILGTDLTGATSVTFNGTAATFTVIAPTAIKVDVPSGAATGAVQVVTPTGTAHKQRAFPGPVTCAAGRVPAPCYPPSTSRKAVIEGTKK